MLGNINGWTNNNFQFEWSNIHRKTNHTKYCLFVHSMLMYQVYGIYTYIIIVWTENQLQRFILIAFGIVSSNVFIFIILYEYENIDAVRCICSQIKKQLNDFYYVNIENVIIPTERVYYTPFIPFFFRFFLFCLKFLSIENMKAHKFDIRILI